MSEKSTERRSDWVNGALAVLVEGTGQTLVDGRDGVVGGVLDDGVKLMFGADDVAAAFAAAWIALHGGEDGEFLGHGISRIR